MRESDTNDSTLVHQALAGNKQAFTALIERHADALSAIAFLQVRNGEDARDIVQQAFFVAYRDLDALKDPNRFGAWIRGIVLNLSRKTLEKRTRTRQFLERIEVSPYTPDPVEEVAATAKTREVMCALDALSPVHREVVLLRYFHDTDVNDIARLVGRPAGTVKRMLAEARGVLREELIEMAREEFCEYQLSDEHRRRLAKIPTFPRMEPKISVQPLDESASQIRAVGFLFSALRPGSEVSYADYDHPGGKLKTVNHTVAEGPIDFGGRPAFRIDGIAFTGEGKAEQIWRPYYRVEGDTIVRCAIEYGPPGSPLSRITPDDPKWQDKPVSLAIVPGSQREPDGHLSGNLVDSNLWQVKIGKRVHRCVRKIGCCEKHLVEWSDTPVYCGATEEYLLEDGRLLLWRYYRGTVSSERNPSMEKDAPDTYERLAEAGMPILEVFGERYYLSIDCIPEYAFPKK